MSRRPFFEKLLTVLDRNALNRLAREVCDIESPWHMDRENLIAYVVARDGPTLRMWLAN
jgi:hypothetical protein